MNQRVSGSKEARRNRHFENSVYVQIKVFWLAVWQFKDWLINLLVDLRKWDRNLPKSAVNLSRTTKKLCKSNQLSFCDKLDPIVKCDSLQDSLGLLRIIVNANTSNILWHFSVPYDLGHTDYQDDYTNDLYEWFTTDFHTVSSRVTIKHHSVIFAAEKSLAFNRQMKQMIYSMKN